MKIVSTGKCYDYIYPRGGRTTYECECPKCHEVRTYYSFPKQEICNVCREGMRTEKREKERELLTLAKANLDLLMPKMPKEMKKYWEKNK